MQIPKKLIFNFFTKQYFNRGGMNSILGSRLGSMSSDLMFMLAIAGPLFFIMFIPIFIIIGTSNNVSILMPLWIGFIPFSLLTFLIINKDFYNGRSIAKRQFGYQIVDTKTNQTASEFQCMIRNSTMIIWPLEVLVTMFNPTRRIGDLIAGTKIIDVEKEDPELIMKEIEQEKEIDNKTKLIWTSIIISIGFTGFTAFPTLLTIY